LIFLFAIEKNYIYINILFLGVEEVLSPFKGELHDHQIALNAKINQRRAKVENGFDRLKNLSIFKAVYRGDRSNCHDIAWIGANLVNVDVRLHPLREDFNHLVYGDEED